MGMDRDDHILDAADVVGQPLDAAAEVLRHLIAGRVRDVDHGGAGVDRRLDDALEEGLVGAAGILRIELDVVHVLPGIAHAVGSALHDLILRHAKLLAHVLGAHAEAGMDAGPLGRREGLGRAVDVRVDGPGQRDYHGIVTRKTPDILDRPEVPRTRDGETRLDCIHVQTEQLLGDDQLLLGVHRGPGALLAVAQRGVEDVDLAGHGDSLYLLCLSEEGLVAAVGLVDVGLAHSLPGSVHGEHRHAAVDDLHAVLGQDVGDGSAAARVDLPQLAGLEAHVALVHHTADVGHVLGVGVVGTRLATGARELVKGQAVAQQGRVLLLEDGREGGVEGRGHIRGKHARVGEAAT